MARCLQKNQMLKYWKFQEHQKLICCFSNAFDSKSPKEALYLLIFCSLFLKVKSLKASLEFDFNIEYAHHSRSVMSACWDFLSLKNSGHFLNFEVILSDLPWVLIEMVTSLLLEGCT